MSTQVSLARAAGWSRGLAGTTATARQAHNALADTVAALMARWGPDTPAQTWLILDGTDKLTYTYLATARDHTFTCLNPNHRARLTRPEHHPS